MATKPATQLNTGDRIVYGVFGVVTIVAAHNWPGNFGTGVRPSPYAEHKGTDSELHSMARKADGARILISFARDAEVEIAS